jgi:hypothetical protein
VGGCVLFDRAALVEAGGFSFWRRPSFWRRLPRAHVGEDVVAQLRAMARRGGCGLLPSRAWHQEVRTTLARRDLDAPFLLAGEVHADLGGDLGGDRRAGGV